MWCYIAETRRLASSRFPQVPMASRLVGKLHTFTLHPQVAAKKKCTSGSVLASPVVFTWGFFPVCQQLLFAAAHKPERPRAGRLFLSVTNSPCCRAPEGLACSIFVRRPTPLRGLDLHFQISKRREIIPIGLQCLDLLCTPHRCCANKKTAIQSSGRLTPPTAHNLVNVCVIFEHLFIC